MEDDRGPSFPARSLGGSVFGASQSIPWLHSVSLHDIETRADCIYTVSNSLVNPQTPEVVTNLVEDYLYKEFEKLHSRNTIKVIPGFGGLPWVGDINHWNFQAAYEATKVRRRRMYIFGSTTWIPITTLTERLWKRARTILYARGRHYPTGVYTSERTPRQAKRVAVAYGQIRRRCSVSSTLHNHA